MNTAEDIAERAIDHQDLAGLAYLGASHVVVPPEGSPKTYYFPDGSRLVLREPQPADPEGVTIADKIDQGNYDNLAAKWARCEREAVRRWWARPDSMAPEFLFSDGSRLAL